MREFKDEILSGEPIYNITDGDGNVIHAGVSIDLVTTIIQEGTPLNKALFDEIQTYIDTRTYYVAGAYTGDGTEDRTINVGFKPQAVLVWQVTNGGGVSKDLSNTMGFATRDSEDYFAGFTGAKRGLVEVTDNGFIVSYSVRGSDVYAETNANDRIYNYIAFK